MSENRNNTPSIRRGFQTRNMPLAMDHRVKEGERERLHEDNQVCRRGIANHLQSVEV